MVIPPAANNHDTGLLDHFWVGAESVRQTVERVSWQARAITTRCCDRRRVVLAVFELVRQHPRSRYPMLFGCFWTTCELPAKGNVFRTLFVCEGEGLKYHTDVGTKGSQNFAFFRQSRTSISNRRRRNRFKSVDGAAQVDFLFPRGRPQYKLALGDVNAISDSA